MRLVAIGLAAGVFSALFGVGGGIVIVPLLILAGFDERPATGTSLAAIGLIALAGTVLYALRGHVEPGPGALVGIPAAVGALAGAALQQRVATRLLTIGFAALLAVLGVRLVIA